MFCLFRLFFVESKRERRTSYLSSFSRYRSLTRKKDKEIISNSKTKNRSKLSASNYSDYSKIGAKQVLSDERATADCRCENRSANVYLRISTGVLCALSKFEVTFRKAISRRLSSAPMRHVKVNPARARSAARVTSISKSRGFWPESLSYVNNSLNLTRRLNPTNSRSPHVFRLAAEGVLRRDEATE